jgi:hypothetical protein
MQAANDNSAPGWLPKLTASHRLWLWLWLGSYLALPLVLGIVVLSLAH